MWFFLLVIFSVPVYAEDVSRLCVNAGSFNPDGSYAMETKIHVIIKDSLDRQVGYNPFVDELFNSIPNSSYDVMSINDNESGSLGPESIELFLRPASGEYSIFVFAVDNTEYSLDIRGYRRSIGQKDILTFSSYITSGTTDSYIMQFDPAPNAPAPTIIKEVTFEILRNDINVAYKLNQLSDKKFKDELIKIIDRAEKLSIKCKKKKKDENCGNKKAAVNQLKSLIKRMEQALKKSVKEKDKKKKFITEEALNIIRDDAEILIKDLGGKVKSKKDKKTKKWF
ncbi:MAG: hypothetical protein KAI33_10070 [Elusimicrobiales bacterium]|nr:hypothetical protein [Elusimicrobiales bacterium]